MSIPVKELKAAAKSLNTILPAGSKIKLVPAKPEKILADFSKKIAEINDEGKVNELPDDVVDFYNEYVAADEVEADEVEADEVEADEVEADETEEKPKSTKKTVGKKTVGKKTVGKKTDDKEKTKPKKTSTGGYTEPSEGSQAYKIDSILKKGSTVEKIVEKTGLTKSRVNTRIKSLIDRGANVVEKDGTFTLTV